MEKMDGALAMTDFGWRLSDAEMANVFSFIRGIWENHAPSVSRDKVGRVRKTLAIQKSKQE